MTLESHASGWRDLGTVGWSVVQRKQSFGGLTIMFSKLVTMAVNCCSLLRTVFENRNRLIYVQQSPLSEDSRK